ncbi:MAG: transcriptional regulator, family [Herbinix sp.]|jgi:transcriptional regulator with XRE-family HTH domain|nr:transcriptional regulator, family [Herbinix sp.]
MHKKLRIKKGDEKMTSLRLAENIIKLRHSRGITQDELANFLSITKASVSKWETGQSLPDILLLPQIANYFDITIDELLGYKPQLSPEQIRTKYHSLAADFVTLPFEEVMEKSKKLVKEYYSCYPFLLQIGVLWLNHFMYAEGQKRQMEIFSDIAELCEHISKECVNVGVCSDAIVLKAMVNLQLGKVQEAIDTLEPLNDPKRFSSQSDCMLIQAYQMQGDLPKADLYNQITIYTHLLSLVGNSISYLTLHLQDKEIGDKTIARITKLLDTYDLEHLNPNSALQFHFHAALFHSMHGEKDLALTELKTFVKGSLSLINEGCVLHGDHYFTRLDEWFGEIDLGIQPPRNVAAILDNVKQAIVHPAFAILFDTDEYQGIKKLLYHKGE